MANAYLCRAQSFFLLNSTQIGYFPPSSSGNMLRWYCKPSIILRDKTDVYVLKTM